MDILQRSDSGSGDSSDSGIVGGLAQPPLGNPPPLANPSAPFLINANDNASALPMSGDFWDQFLIDSSGVALGKDIMDELESVKVEPASPQAEPLSPNNSSSPLGSDRGGSPTNSYYQPQMQQTHPFPPSPSGSDTSSNSSNGGGSSCLISQPQVWPPTQLYYVDFSQSKIGVKKVCFQQTHNQGLRQLLLTVSWDLRA